MLHGFSPQSIIDLGTLAYLVIFIGMILEGEIVLFSAAFLTHTGVLRPELVLPLVIIGVLIGDTTWYFAGRKFGHRIKFIKKILAHIELRFGDRLRNKPYTTFIITKFTYGLHRTALLTAGALKLPIKKFFKSDFLASGIWLVGIWTIAYLSAQSFRQFKHTVRNVEIYILVGLIVLYTSHRIFMRLTRKEL